VAAGEAANCWVWADYCVTNRCRIYGKWPIVVKSAVCKLSKMEGMNGELKGKSFAATTRQMGIARVFIFIKASRLENHAAV